MDEKNPNEHFLCLFQDLIDLYRFGTLLIPDDLIKAVLIVERNALFNFKYKSHRVEKDENLYRRFKNFKLNFRKSKKIHHFFFQTQNLSIQIIRCV